MTDYPIWYYAVAAVLAGILGVPFGIWFYYKFQPHVDKVLDATLGKLLDRFGL